MPELSLGGARISYADSGGGEPLLFLHGWIGSGALWNLMAPWLSERFRVIVPDLPGHGDSGIPAGFSFDLDAFSRFIEEMRTELELPSLTLVGHSMGGSISMYYAGRYPGGVERLVLIDSPASRKALMWPSRLPCAERLLGLIYPLWGPGIVTRLIKSSVRHPGSLPPDFLDGAVAQACLLKKEALVGTTRTIRSLDLDGEVAGIKVPVLLIHGDRDPSVKPSESGRLQGLLPGARLHVIPDCGHCPNYEYPDRVVELVEEFMASGV
ncbi:MAG: alpha/beta hydrolase [Actinobacteria bacterium]|nr:alpha/beta hydrolase [Actinomycetota bacterium]